MSAPALDVPALDVRGITFAYPDGHGALFGVDLRIDEGERVALLGPNGAGKTTLVLHLNGILGGGAGEVRVTGLSVTKPNLREVRQRVGIVFQDPDDQLFMAAVEQVCQPMTYDSTLGKLPSNYDNAIYDCQGYGDELAALG